MFIDLLGFGIIIPIIPVYITNYGGTPLIGGALLACYSLMQFILSPVWGRASDNIGRRPIILIGLCGSAISFLAFGLAGSIAVLFVARVFAGALSAASLPTAQAYIADITTPEKRTGGMAVIGIAFGLGFALGPLFGTFLSQYQIPFTHLPPISTPAMFSALLCLLNLIGAYFLLPESRHPDAMAQSSAEKMGPVELILAVGKVMHNPRVSRPITVFIFSTFAFAAVESSFSWLMILRFHPLIVTRAMLNWSHTHPSISWAAASFSNRQPYLEKSQASIANSVFIVVGLTSLVVQGCLASIGSRLLSEKKMVILGVGSMFLSLIGITFSHSMLSMEFLSGLLSAGASLSGTPLNALITAAAEKDEIGLVSGAQQGLSSMARVIAPPINNYLVGVNTMIPFLSSSALMFISMLMSLRLKPISHEQDPVVQVAGEA